MNPRIRSSQLFPLITTAFAAMVFAGTSLIAGAALAGVDQSITLNAGETHVIDNLSPDSIPGVTIISNPHAMLLHDEAPGKLVILGAEEGKWEVSVKRKDGEKVTYDITVHSIEDWSNGPNPGKAPEPVASTAPPAPQAAASPAATTSRTHVLAQTSAPVAAPAAVQPSDQRLAVAAPSGSQSRVLHANPAIAASGDGYSTDGVMNSPGAHYLPNDAISMMTGTSQVFDFRSRLRRVSISATEVADIQVINPFQLNLIAHKPGFTTLTVWTGQGRYVERQVRVDPGGKQQVMLNCVVAELDRGRTEQQGVNLSLALENAGLSLVGLPGPVATPYSPNIQISGMTPFGPVSYNQAATMLPGGSLMPMLLSQNITYGLATSNGQWNTQTFFQMLEDHNLAKILARPDLLASSGEQASFLAGGEVPIVIAQALNTSIQFKTYGTQVKFLPTVVGLNQIELLVEPEVSQLDYQHAVQLFGFTVPAFLARRARTLVRMKDGQTLIVAGLNQHEKHEVIQKVPYLGDVPYLGGLFRNTQYVTSNTDLVMTVTPRIVRPLPSGADAYLPPLSRGDLTAAEVRTERTATPDAGRPRF